MRKTKHGLQPLSSAANLNSLCNVKDVNVCDFNTALLRDAVPTASTFTPANNRQ